MPTTNKNSKEGFHLVLTQLPVAVATLAFAALLLLASHKTDFAAWIFVLIFTVIGCGVCVFFTLKTRKLYLQANGEKPTQALLLSLLETGVALLASITFFIITLIQFII